AEGGGLGSAKPAAERARTGDWHAVPRLREGDISRRRQAGAVLPASPVDITNHRGFTTSDASVFPQMPAVVDDIRRRRAELALGVGVKPYLLDHPLTSLDAASPLVDSALDPVAAPPPAATRAI